MEEHPNSERYFENRNCTYYPCHDLEHINCLFCYCPLYQYEDCPGDHTYIERYGRKIKNCAACTFPHVPEHFDRVLHFLADKNAGK